MGQEDVLVQGPTGGALRRDSAELACPVTSAEPGEHGCHRVWTRSLCAHRNFDRLRASVLLWPSESCFLETVAPALWKSLSRRTLRCARRTQVGWGISREMSSACCVSGTVRDAEQSGVYAVTTHVAWCRHCHRTAHSQTGSHIGSQACRRGPFLIPLVLRATATV